jgi:hypothetical protein
MTVGANITNLRAQLNDQAVLTTYTQTYATAATEVTAATAAAVATTGTTNSSPYGFTAAAQGDALVAGYNALVLDVLQLRKLVTSLIDDAQAQGRAL